MADKYESFVRWYLRFNGFFSVENFVIHEAGNGDIIPEGGEFDTIAVRYPHSKEQVDHTVIINDHRLDDAETKADELIDFVIAEVKSGRRNTLNSLWQTGDEEKKVRRVKYLLRWVGALKNEPQIGEVAGRLQREHRAREQGNLFRLIYFSPHIASEFSTTSDRCSGKIGHHDGCRFQGFPEVFFNDLRTESLR